MDGMGEGPRPTHGQETRKDLRWTQPCPATGEQTVNPDSPLRQNSFLAPRCTRHTPTDGPAEAAPLKVRHPERESPLAHVPPV